MVLSETMPEPASPNVTGDIRIRAGTHTMRTLPAGHGRLHAQNTHLGIADTVTALASTAPIGGSRALAVLPSGPRT